MLRPKAQFSLKDAKDYFSEHLSVGDYYSERQGVAGEWIGKGAAMLGLRGEVTEESFHRLCDNQNPQGDPLTPHKRSRRRIFYDYIISPPKSVSLAALVLNDAEVIEAHDRAVDVMMNAYEDFAEVRDHKNGIRRTGNFIAAKFRHDTSRALDPFLHTHCIVFNATYDSKRERFMAYESFSMFRAQKFAENLYYHELSRSLRKLGYGIVNSARGDFEIEGVSREVIDLFSKRFHSIAESVDQLLEEKPDLTKLSEGELRKKAAVWNRPEKRKDVRADLLRDGWFKELSNEQVKELQNLRTRNRSQQHSQKATRSVEESLSWAEEHLFDRKAVVEEQELWRHALSYGRGEDFSFAHLQNYTRMREDFIYDQDHPGRLTTEQAYDQESKILKMVNDGLFAHAPYVEKINFGGTTLYEEQRLAAERLLSSRSFLNVFRGGAGTGKSFTLDTIRKELLRAGHPVVVTAPQNQQAIDLEKDGLLGAQTLSRLLTSRQLPRGVVVILDEAGQVGREQMLDLLELVSSVGGRVICSGDTRQHGSVTASNALEAIEKYSDLKTVNLREIKRQDPDKASNEEQRRFIEKYREAVKLASEDDTEASYKLLDRLGVVSEVAPEKAREELAKAYLDKSDAGESVVVVSQTWSEIHQLNAALRNALREGGQLVGEETLVESLQPRDLTNAQKRDERFYDENSIVVFNRPCMGFQRGERARLLYIGDSGLVVEGDDRVKPIHFKHLDKVTVARPKQISVSRGEQLQLKANGQSLEGRRLANGEIVKVKQVLEEGGIELEDGRTLPSDFRQFVSGYAVTSYGAQGKTADHVLFSDSAVKAATDAKQWYVTISRGSKSVQIFTQDKDELEVQVQELGKEALALDLRKTRQLVPVHARAGLLPGSQHLIPAKHGHSQQPTP